jgi:hypothetical protein
MKTIPKSRIDSALRGDQKSTNQVMSIMEFKKLTGKKRNKFNAETCEYRGRKYDSKGEMEYAIKLDWRKKSGEIAKITPQYPIAIIVSGHQICNYVIDFKIDFTDGHIEYHEYKGCETDLWKLKWKLAKALYPDYKFVLIKN